MEDDPLMPERYEQPNNDVVIIGGTFNPFTNAHLEMGRTVSRLLPSADIIYIPTNLKYIADWKELPCNDIFSGDDREALITKATEDIPRCSVSDMESTGKISGRTYDTVQLFKNSYGRVFICIGTDKLYEIERWYMAEELLQDSELLLFTRGASVEDCDSEFIRRHRNRITEIGLNYPEVSSSLIRELYSRGELEEIRNLVPLPIYEYIKGKADEDSHFQKQCWNTCTACPIERTDQIPES